MKCYFDNYKVNLLKNHTLIIYLGIALFVGFFNFSCKHDISQTEGIISSGVILSVDEAQKWFEEQPDSTITLKSGRVGKHLELKNDWRHAHESQNNTLGVVDVDICSKGRFGFLFTEGKQVMERTGNEKYLNSLSRLVLQKNRYNGCIESFVMTLIASPEYLEKQNFDLTNNTYLKRQKDFTGYVLYHSVSGAFVNGWNYAQGKIVGKCSQAEKINSPVVLKQADCLVTTVTLYNQFCTDWYDNSGRYTNTNCEERTVDDVFYYLSCLYEPSGTGFSGGGFEGGYTPLKPLPCPGDPINNPSIASSGASGVAGGMFGCVRIGNSERCNYQKKFHDGIDIKCEVNKDVYPMYPGVVVAKNNSFRPKEYAEGSYGNYVTIKYTTPDGYSISVKYNHLNSVNVNINDNVTLGQIIGESGNTGNAASRDVIPHIHIQVFENDTSVDPIGYFATLFNADGTVLNACY